MKKFSKYLVFSFLVVLLSGCSLQTNDQKVTEIKKSGATVVKKDKLKEVITRKREKRENLTKKEKWALLFILEEEKMIRDLSYNFSDKYEDKIFEDIYKAENSHIDPVQKIVRDYNLDDPSSKKDVGEFHNPQIRMIYDELLKQGQKDKVSAYKALLQALERNISNLNENIDKTDKDGILFLFRNLRRSSKNHMKSLLNKINSQGENYQPAHLSKPKLNSIKESEIDSGTWWPF